MAGSSNSATSISVFFPCLNDGPSLARMIPQIAGVLEKITSDFEIIVVDDGSTDDTPAKLESMKARIPALRVIRHRENRGYGGALQTGFLSATKDWVFYTDGDGQYDVGEFTKLWALVDEGIDGVVGYKVQRSDTWIRLAIGKFYNAWVRFFFNLKVRDVDCDFRLLRRKIFDRISLTARSGGVCVELMRKIQSGGYRILETSVTHLPRQHGKSQYFRLAPVARTGWELVSLWFRLML